MMSKPSGQERSKKYVVACLCVALGVLGCDTEDPAGYSSSTYPPLVDYFDIPETGTVLSFVGYSNSFQQNRERYGGFHECSVRDDLTQSALRIDGGVLHLKSDHTFDVVFFGERWQRSGEWISSSAVISGTLDNVLGLGTASTDIGRTWFTRSGPANGAWRTIVLSDPGPNTSERRLGSAICSSLFFSDKPSEVLWWENAVGMEGSFLLDYWQTRSDTRSLPITRGNRYVRYQMDSIRVDLHPSGRYDYSTWETLTWSQSGGTGSVRTETQTGSYIAENGYLVLNPNDAGSVFGKVYPDSLVLYGRGIDFEHYMTDVDLHFRKK